GNFEAFTGVELEKIDAALQRHDPAIEQRFGTDERTAEIVDDEGAVQRLHMQGRFIVFGDRIEFQIQHLESQLAAGNHHRTPASDPPRIEALTTNALDLAAVVRGARCGVVERGIEHLHDLAADFDAVGYIDDVLIDRGDFLGDGRLAVAGGTVEQDTAAGIHRRAQASHEIRGYHQIGEGAIDRALLDALV